MNTHPSEQQVILPSLKKCKTGIKGLDEVLNGGLPQGRTSLVCGVAGCGKTLMACEFLVRGAIDYDEPGVFMAFEETQTDLAQNLASLGIDLEGLIAEGKIFVDHIKVDRNEIEETGEYDLEGLFIRLASAIEIVGAKRVVLDTIEAIFAGFTNESILRSELRRLFSWLKEKGVTAVVTGERGAGMLTRHGLEEYVSDCVILLEQRLHDNIATRTLRVIKYRGSAHGNNDYPFLIDQNGIWIMPITSVGLDYPVSREFISSGVARLDQMLNGKGFYRGSSILVSGMAGTGKTSLAAHLIHAACQSGERCLYIAYEESGDQIIRNMRSIGVDLKQWVEQGLLLIHSVRSSFYGSEMHLLTIQKTVLDFKPSVVVMDPITNLIDIASTGQVKAVLVRIIDFFKMQAITTFYTNLTHGGAPTEATEVGISSLMDTWILLSSVENNGERNRTISIIKSRGMSHSNQAREFLLTDHGIELLDVYVGQGFVLTGSARVSQEAAEQAEAEHRQREIERKKREFDQKRKMLEAQMDLLKAQIEAAEEEVNRDLEQAEWKEQAIEQEREDIARARKADPQSNNGSEEME